MNLPAWILGWRGYAAAGAVAFVLGAGSSAWICDRLADHAKLRQARAASAAQAKAIKVEHRLQATSDAIGAAAEAHQVQIRTVYKTLTRKVPVYVTPETDRRYLVPRGYVSLWNAAAAGDLSAPPDAAGGAYDQPSDVAFSQLGLTTVEAFGSCNAARQQLIDLQAWVRATAER